MCCLLSVMPVSGQETSRDGADRKVEDLRREQAQTRSRLDRLVELKILTDLGGTIPPDVLASLLPETAPASRDELEQRLREHEQRLTAERERFAAARAGMVAPRRSGPETRPSGKEPPPAGSAVSDHHTVASGPGESRPASSPAARPTGPASQPVERTPPGPPAVTLAKALPSLRAAYTLVQSGHLEEARAMLAEFPAGAMPQSILVFLQAGIAEQGGDFDGAERMLVKAMAEETRAGRGKGAQFESMKLALDHVTWKKNRVEFNRLLAGVDASKQGR
jgi:hypothetical protein